MQTKTLRVTEAQTFYFQKHGYRADRLTNSQTKQTTHTQKKERFDNFGVACVTWRRDGSGCNTKETAHKHSIFFKFTRLAQQKNYLNPKKNTRRRDRFHTRQRPNKKNEKLTRQKKKHTNCPNISFFEFVSIMSA